MFPRAFGWLCPRQPHILFSPALCYLPPLPQLPRFPQLNPPPPPLRLGLFGFFAEAKIPGSVPALSGIVKPYSGEFMAPFSATDKLPFVEDMLKVDVVGTFFPDMY